MTAASGNSLNVALRWPRTVYTIDSEIDTLTAHNEVVESQGRVAVAKFGRRMSASRTAELKRQLEEKVPSKLILVFRSEDKSYYALSAELTEVLDGETLPSAKLVPAYYRASGLATVRNWFVTDTKFTPDEISRFRIGFER